jgi:hypothetical protein
MSRARKIGGLWFDRHLASHKATSEQLELLSAAENIALDDLLDEGLVQREVALRLRMALGEGVIPAEVLERRRAAKQLASMQPECRICSALEWDCEGSITKHHFIPRWMMLLLENYQSYAARSKCCIPICVGRHRDLHLRGDTETPKSIAQFLDDRERKFAQKLLDEIREQHPAVFDLVAGGDEGTYEYVLIRDYQLGLFSTSRSVAGTARFNYSQESAQATG